MSLDFTRLVNDQIPLGRLIRCAGYLSLIVKDDGERLESVSRKQTVVKHEPGHRREPISVT